MTKPLIANLYNPHEQSKEELIASFVVRQKTFHKLFQVIKRAKMQHPEQHFLIEGQRGMGKTTLLLRLSYEIENDNDLNTWLMPVVLKEEAYYHITHLFNLWEEVAKILANRNAVFASLYQQMDAVYDENRDYERLCFDLLIKALKTHAYKIILFLDNVGEMFKNFNELESHRLREILMTCPYLRIIGATAVTLEASFQYQHAFYEFFKKYRLANLDKTETHNLLLQLAKTYQAEKTIQTIIATQPGRVETLRILTGGVIRTVILLFEIFIDNQNGNAIKDLENILDRVTPLYKHRMDDLAPLQRDVVHSIALQWDAISPDSIAHQTRLKSAQVMTLLEQLEKVFIIQRVPTNTQTDLYYLSERFFNIWYLMRLAPKGSQSKVIWLVRFLESWYNQEELVQRAQKQIRVLKQGDYHPKGAFVFAEALARTGKLDMETEHELKNTTRKYLAETDKNLLAELSPSDKELFEEGMESYWDKEYENATKLLLQVKNQNEDIYLRLVSSFYELKQYDKAEQYYLKTVEKGDVGAINALGVLYQNELNKYQKAEQYYLMAVAKEHVGAMFNLGVLYDEVLKDYAKAEQYYLMAVEKGNVDAMYNLGLLYKNDLENYQQAEQYYLMAKAKKDVDAINNLGVLYQDALKDYPKAKQCYLMAIAKGDVDAMHNLAVLYFEQKKYKQKALKLSKKAVNLKKEKLYIQILGIIYLWNNLIENSIQTICELLDDNTVVDEYAWYLNTYLMLLIAKQQYQHAMTYFETPDLNLTDRFKPLYYALLYFMGDNNYQKCPPELTDPVNDIIEKIKQMAVDYA